MSSTCNSIPGAEEVYHKHPVSAKSNAAKLWEYFSSHDTGLEWVTLCPLMLHLDVMVNSGSEQIKP